MSKREYQAIAQVIREETDHGDYWPKIKAERLVDRLADVFQELEMCPSCLAGLVWIGESVDQVPGTKHMDNGCTCSCHMFDRTKWEAACKEAVA